MSDDRFGINVDEMLPRITEQVAAELRKRAIESLQYSVQEAVRAECQRYITESIVPQVAAELKKHDEEIRAAIVAGITGTAKMLAEEIQTQATKKLASYSGDKLVGKICAEIFGRGY